MSLDDKSVLDAVCGSVLATRMDGIPIYLAIIGAPGSGKSVVIESLKGLRDTYSLSLLTPKTFSSGHKDKGSSLLAQLGETEPKIVLFKDFTSVLSQRPDSRNEIMANLREIYDGSFVGRWGTGKEERWKGKMGLIAGCTGAWDQISQYVGTLGERFIIYRMPAGSPQVIAERALRGGPSELAMQDDLRTAMTTLDGIPVDKIPEIQHDARQSLARLSEFTAHMRTAVPRDNYRREVIGEPELEGTGRISKQFGQLIRGIALFKEHGEIWNDDLHLLEQVALGSLPPTRLKVLQTLPYGGCTVRQLEDLTGRPRTLLGRVLQDMQLLGVLELSQVGYRPVDKFVSYFEAARQPLNLFEEGDDENGN